MLLMFLLFLGVLFSHCCLGSGLVKQNLDFYNTLNQPQIRDFDKINKLNKKCIEDLEKLIAPGSYLKKEDILEKEISFLYFPPDILSIIFNDVFENPCLYLKTITRLNKSMYNVCQNNISLLINILKKADQAIEFQYYFTQNPNGDFHQQDYHKNPLEEPSKYLMRSIIKCVRFLSQQNNCTVNDISNKYELNNYLRFHNEFVFRSCCPTSRPALSRWNLNRYLQEVLGNYIDCCDLKFQVDLSYCNSVEWLKNKISLIDFTTLECDPLTKDASKELKDALFDNLIGKKSDVSEYNLINSNDIFINECGLTKYKPVDKSEIFISDWVLRIQRYIEYKFENLDKTLSLLPDFFQKPQKNLFALIPKLQKEKASDVENQQKSLEEEQQLKEQSLFEEKERLEERSEIQEQEETRVLAEKKKLEEEKQLKKQRKEAEKQKRREEEQKAKASEDEKAQCQKRMEDELARKEQEARALEEKKKLEEKIQLEEQTRIEEQRKANKTFVKKVLFGSSFLCGIGLLYVLCGKHIYNMIQKFLIKSA